MRSFIILELAFGLVACTASPNVHIEVTRTDTTIDTTLTLCPIGQVPLSGTSCKAPNDVFGNTSSAPTQGIEIFVDNSTPALGMFLETRHEAASPTCFELDVAIGPEVEIEYTVDVVPATCTPAGACTQNLNVPSACAP